MRSTSQPATLNPEDKQKTDSNGVPAMEPSFFLPLSPQMSSPVSVSQVSNILLFIFIFSKYIFLLLFLHLSSFIHCLYSLFCFQSFSSLPTLYERRQKKSILNTSALERSKLIATSKHGLVAAGEIEPLQCLVLFYTSSWRIPKHESAALERYNNLPSSLPFPRSSSIVQQ